MDRLEEEGLLRRERTPADRRGAFAVLTEKGQRALDRDRPIYAQGIAEHFGRYLEDSKVGILAGMMERLDRAARQE